MERNYDEVISEMLIQLAAIESSLEKENRRMEAFDKRMDLTIKRMVKAETRLERAEKRTEQFDQKLEQSIKDQKEFSHMQSQMNKYFLDFIKKNSGKS
jgi:predicted  nucleic acid-binding Zn-ribbon protein